MKNREKGRHCITFNKNKKKNKNVKVQLKVNGKQILT